MKKLMILVLITTLHACATSSADFGESHRNNREVQTVNPEASAAASTVQGMDGIKAGIALEEYKKADDQNSNERLVRDVAN